MNKILDFIKKIESKYFITFKPTKDFYKHVGIGQKRWKMILNNDVPINSNEIEKLSDYFEVPANELLSIFSPKQITD